MPISFACTGCGRNLQTPDSMAGKKGKCPHCNAVMQIPAASSADDADPFGFGGSSSKPAASPPPAGDLFGDLGASSSSSSGGSYGAGGAPRGFAYQPPGATASRVYSGSSHGSEASQGRAVTSLICGIIGAVTCLASAVCCCLPAGPLLMLIGEGVSLVLGIVAWVVGQIEIRASGPNGPTRGMATAGMICGIVTTVVAALLCVLGLLIILGLTAFILSSPEFRNR